MSLKKNSLGIVILNYGEPSYTINLLIKLIKYKEVTKIIIVDNFSKKKNYNFLKKKINSLKNKKIFLFKRKNLGYSAGNNYGLKFCFDKLKLKYGLVLNPDINLKKNISFDSIHKLNHKDQIIFTTMIKEKKNIYSLLRFNEFNFKSYKFKQSISNQKLPIYAGGSCIGFTKGFWQSTKGFDQDYFLYFEELDLIYKYKKKFNIFPKVVSIKQIKINHYKNKLMIDKNNNYTTTVDYWSSLSRMLFAKKNLPHFILNALAYNLLKSLFRLTQFKFHNFFLILFGTIRGILK